MRESKTRRGATMMEVLIGMSIALVVLTALAMFTNTAGKMFVSCTEGIEGQQQAEKAIQSMSRDIRSAQSVSTTSRLSASPPKLVLQMPAYDANQTLVVPITAGNTVTYTCSTNGKTITRSESNGTTTVVAKARNYGSVQLSIQATGVDANSNGLIEPDEYTALTPKVQLQSRYLSTKKSYDRTYTATEQVMLRNH
jgi:Tfp pilus assembly protein PilW